MNAQQNNLSPLNYKMKIARTPELEYRVQTIDLPGISLGTANRPTMFGAGIPYSGDLTFEDLNLSFLIGENMADYLEIWSWLMSLGHASDFDSFPKKLTDGFSDVSILLLNSAMKPKMLYKFIDAYPTNISSIHLDTTLTDVQYATCSVNFKYSRYLIETL